MGNCFLHNCSRSSTENPLLAVLCSSLARSSVRRGKGTLVQPRVSDYHAFQPTYSHSSDRHCKAITAEEAVWDHDTRCLFCCDRPSLDTLHMALTMVPFGRSRAHILHPAWCIKR